MGLKIKIILVYFDARTTPEGKERNLEIKNKIKRILKSVEEDALVVLGDFNAHIGLLGAKTIDRTGRMIVKRPNEYNLTMLNLDDRCEGTTIWEAREQKSTVDFVLVSQKMYSRFIEKEIDEKREKIDISDHNLITVKFKMKKTNRKNK
ncbi:unnamed protein product [Meganyctiphanes norvegica]|uniref:Endonuclease/exonuclease/phosphatase domain-containing protein n=1 Tax=Meganyctiphanes norvegica TaxID=48144 RepID=A0AAV2PZE9_MEGNR